MGIFLIWLDITVTTVFELLWYLIASPPPRTPLSQAADGSAKATPPSLQRNDDSSPPPPTAQADTDSPKKETLASAPNPPHQGTTTEQPPPPLFALIIGIDEYADPNLDNLNGAVADADAINTFLQENLNVPKGKIKNLRNGETTRLTIEGAIQDLGNDPAIKKDDPILIFYAGHGAEADAPSGWSSASGKIQMLVPYDFAKSGSRDSKHGQGVLDMRLSRLLQALAEKKSDNITVILDCCHSGGGTRDDNDQTFAVRGIDLPASYTIPDDLLRGIRPDTRTSAPAPGYEHAGLLSHVLLSACKAEQKAREKDRRGAFTLELLRVLQDQKVDKLTYTDVMAYLRRQNLPEQDPQCEGVHRDRRLFNSKVASPHREIYTIRYQASQLEDRDCGRAPESAPVVAKTGQFVLEAGEAHGITRNAEFAVFADRNTGSESGWKTQSALGTVVAVQTTAFTTICDFTQRDDKTQSFSLEGPGLALQTRVGDGQDVRLFIELAPELISPVFEPVAKEMEMEKEVGKRSFSLVNSREDHPDLVVSLTEDHKHVRFEIMDNVCRDHGLTYMPFEVSIDERDKLKRILRDSADFYWHLHRSSKGSPLAGKVNLECMKLKETNEYNDDLQAVLMPDADGHNLNVGGVITVDVAEEAIYGFRITYTSAVPLYAWMFYFDMSNLSISSYYQPGHGKNADFSLPGKGSLTIGYGASGTVSHMYTLGDRQDVDVGFLKMFFSTEYMDLSGVVQSSPFEDVRTSVDIKNKTPTYMWHTMCVPLVQKRESAPRDAPAAARVIV